MTKRKNTYVAFFDLDDTLLEVNSGRALIKMALELGFLRKRDLALSFWYSILHKLNLAHSTRIVKRIALWLKGLEEKTFRELSETLCENLLFDNISQSILKELEYHRSRNANIVLLSAALPYICKPIAAKLKVDELICSSLEVIDGLFTGLPDGILVFGNEKGKRLKEYCMKNGYSLEHSYCYADSYSDKPMMEITGNPVAVRPDRRLGNVARKRGWRVIN